MPKKTNFTANGSNYYRVTATIGRDGDGKPIRKQFYGSSKKEAEAKRDEYLLNINKGLSINFDKALFKNAFNVWFENVLKPSVALSTYIRYKTEYDIRINESVLDGLKLTSIKAVHMQGFYNELLERHSIKTVQHTHKLLNKFFNYCTKAELIVKSPLAAVELPKDNQPENSGKALSNDDISKILAACKDNTGYFIYVFAIFSGLRLGEILALTHADIDFKRNVITVNKSVKHLNVNGEFRAVLSHTKTVSSVREVPILKAIINPLKGHIRNEQLKHLKLGIPVSGYSILFSSTSCEYRESGNVRDGLVRLCNRVGIPRTTFHSLRHTFCTILAKQGISLKTASVLMGHNNISITAKIYTHVDSEELKKGIEKLSVYFE